MNFSTGESTKPEPTPLLTNEPHELQIWGGIECTVNRVGDCYLDQTELTGHRARLDDLNRIASLGIQSLRYPILWEHHPEPDSDWSWAEQRLQRLRELQIDPIVGLVHHGSGPRHTSLLDPGFADGLAAHASQVARRFPWLRRFTPVNEPLTTARFSNLYGIWFPHHRSDQSFVRALLVECEATRKSMRAIRAINPAAQLVQTEDMGRTYSTELLAYQAHFDNLRRWLSLDMLCGIVDSEHPLWDYLRENGATATELDSFVKDPCPPDLIGINYYATSERFLDERLERYPTVTHGGNGHHAYADVCAVRVCASGIAGPYGILKECWDRYQIPIAVTEAHLGCTREEQLRWLVEVWSAAQKIRSEGSDVRAVTVWSLFGAYDWNHLLTCHRGDYEPGVFDLRAPQPRPTAIANCVRDLARQGRCEHAVLAEKGWWRRNQRLLYEPVIPVGGTSGEVTAPQLLLSKKTSQPILITGATGTLGQAFKRLADVRGLNCRLLTRRELDIADPVQIKHVLEELKPWAIVNTAGYVRVDDAESGSERCFRENTQGPTRLAEACQHHGIRLVTFSSDLVFDGTTNRPYVESAAPAPLNVYGRSKAEAEKFVLEVMSSALVVRTSAFFGPWDKYNFVTQTLERLRAGLPVEALSDAVISPTYVPDLVNNCLDLLVDGESGICHLVNTGEITWSQFARKIAEWAGLLQDLIHDVRLNEIKLAAARPRYSAITSERFQIMPPLDHALTRYFAECPFAKPAPATNGHHTNGSPPEQNANSLTPCLASPTD
jgi:dTDP-4-dehydrorhamnose reductase